MLDFKIFLYVGDEDAQIGDPAFAQSLSKTL